VYCAVQLADKYLSWREVDTICRTCGLSRQPQHEEETPEETLFAYMEGLDLQLPSQERRFVDALGIILYRIGNVPVDRPFSDRAASAEWERLYANLSRSLGVDGWRVDDYRLVPSARLLTDRIRKLTPRQYQARIEADLKLIETFVDSQPSQAIGAAKNVAETVSRIVLAEMGLQPSQKDPTVQQLVGEAFKALDLRLTDGDDNATAMAAVRKIVAGFSQITGGLATLRNLDGGGHGRIEEKIATPNLARLTVNSSATISMFMLEELDKKNLSVPTF
jgi:hypothetical protein